METRDLAQSCHDNSGWYMVATHGGHASQHVTSTSEVTCDLANAQGTATLFGLRQKVR